MQRKRVEPPLGTYRTVTKFLLFPLTIESSQEDGSRIIETKWLTEASWEEKWTRCKISNAWIKMRFV